MRRRMAWALVLAVCLTLSTGALAAPAAVADVRAVWAPNATVFAVVTQADTVYIGGKFTRVSNTVTGSSRSVGGLAAFDRITGELIDSWTPSANGAVRSLAVGLDGTVYAGGDFTSVDGLSRAHLVAIGPDGSVVPDFSPDANRRVQSLTAIGPALYAGGTFSQVGGQRHDKLARIDLATGQVDSGWRPSASGGRVSATAPSPVAGQLLAGGSFTSVNGQPRSFLASVSLVDGQVSSWAPRALCDTCTIFDLAADATDVYAAVGGSGGGRAASWSPQGDQPRWATRGDGNVQAVAVRNGTVYAGGHFGPEFAGQQRHQLAALDATDGALLPFQVPFTGRDHPGVWDISADDDRLRIVGGFTGIEGSTGARYAEVDYPMTP